MTAHFDAAHRRLDVAKLNLPGSYLVLEVTNRCPLKCGHCAVSEADDGHPHYAVYEHMPVGMVRELLQDLRASGLTYDALILFWLGEPLSHPQFTEIYATVLEYSGDGEIFGKIEVTQVLVMPCGDAATRASAKGAQKDKPTSTIQRQASAVGTTSGAL